MHPLSRASDGGALPRVRVIALGNLWARDDGAALRAAERLHGDALEVLLLGRPGPDLLDAIDPAHPVLILDVVRRGASPGQVIELRIRDLSHATVDGEPLSSHGLGVAQAFRLAEALGRALPRGRFLGIGGRRFDPGGELTEEVQSSLDAYVARAEEAIDALRACRTG